MANDLDFSENGDSPTNPAIGKQLPKKQGGTWYIGEIKPKPDVALGIYGGPAIITLHEKGIKIRNKYYQNQIEIHHSRIINIELNREESFLRDRSTIGRVLLGILVVLTLGFILSMAIAENTSRDGTRTIVKDVFYLELKFWDTNTRSEQSITLTGRRNKIESFIARFNNWQNHSN